MSMTKEQKLAKIKQRYEGLKADGKLAKRTRIARNPLETFNKEQAEEIYTEQFKDGKTIVPIDLKQFWEDSGVSMDFTHAKDKSLRYWEIFVLSKILPEEYAKIHGFYGSKNTAVLRKCFDRNVNFVCESSQDKTECFLNVDVSSVTKK